MMGHMPHESPVAPPGDASPLRRLRRRRLGGTVASAWRIIWIAAPKNLQITIGLQALAAAALAVQLFLGKELLAALTGPDRVQGLSAYMPMLFGLAVAMIVATAANAVVTEQRMILTELIQRHLEERIISVVVGVDIEQLDDPQFHDRHQRAMAAFEDRPWALMNGIVSAVGAVMSIAAIGAVLIPINPWLVPAALLAALPLGWATLRNSRQLYARYRELAVLDRRRGYVRDVLTTPRSAAEVRLFGAEGFFLPLYRSLYDARVRTLQALSRERARRLVTVHVGFALFGVGIVAALIQLTVAGVFTLAEAGLAIVVVQQLLNQLRVANSSAASIHESSLFLPDLTSFLETPASEKRTPPAAEGRSTDPHSLALQNVSFAYPGTQRMVLHDISIHVDAGEVVALVGPNGAGKSTLVKLLCGLYAPTSGNVASSGADGLRPLNRPELPALVTAVFQDFGRYALSARENIVLGELERADEDDDDALHDAARGAGIAAVLERLPHGYDTILSREFEGGTDLSVGQWQRIALARALFRRAPFMVLDEPTAASDATNERAFLDSLRKNCSERGILLITHRLSTARRADRAYVIESGRIVESGTHDMLKASNGLYAELNRLNDGL
jgi:ATP-binding cassette subfamily B protein